MLYKTFRSKSIKILLTLQYYKPNTQYVKAPICTSMSNRLSFYLKASPHFGSKKYIRISGLHMTGHGPLPDILQLQKVNLNNGHLDL